LTRQRRGNSKHKAKRTKRAQKRRKKRRKEELELTKFEVLRRWVGAERESPREEILPPKPRAKGRGTRTRKEAKRISEGGQKLT